MAARVPDRIKTYIQGLDERMGGGIPRGHIILICGPSGSLKSSLAFNIVYHAAKELKLKAVYMSLEQSRTSLIENMRNLGMDHNEVKDDLAVVDLGAVRKKIKDIEMAKSTDWMDSIMKHLRTYRKLGSDIVCIDSLEALYVLSGMKNPRNELFHFFENLRDLNLTSFLISEMPEKEIRFGKYGVESFLSDGIIHLALERYERSVGRFISVVKMRKTKHSTDYYPLLVDEKGFRIVAK
jgi:circadian clock protein KaiC